MPLFPEATAIFVWYFALMDIPSATFDVVFFSADIPLIVYVAESTSSLSSSSLAYMVLNNGPQVCLAFTFKPSEYLALEITCLECQFCMYIISALKRCT